MVVGSWDIVIFFPKHIFRGELLVLGGVELKLGLGPVLANIFPLLKKVYSKKDVTLFCSKVDASARKSKKCLAICGFAGRGSYRCAISYVSSSLGTQCRSAVQERCLTLGALFELFVVACCCIFCKKNLLGVMRLQICKCLKHSLYADYY